MAKNNALKRIESLSVSGVLFISDVIAKDITEYGGFSAATDEHKKGVLSLQNPYALAVIFGSDSTHMAIVKRKMGLSGGGAAVASYEVCDVDYWDFKDIDMYENDKRDVIIEDPKEFLETLEALYSVDSDRERISDLIDKYINLSSPTFQTEGNMLFMEDAEKLSACIFQEKADKITTPLFKINEDDLIYKDLYSSGNGELKDDVGGHVRYITESGRTLDVVNVNRKEGEAALGVDLIYYLREYRSIVMLQYKRLTGGVYYTVSDSNYKKELDRMAKTRELFNVPHSSDANFSHKLFRLSECPYYLKLCPESSFTTNRFVSGACIHLDYWNQLMLSERCITEKGNSKLEYEDLDYRYLRSSEFISLTKRGMLGGYIASIETLAKLLKQLKSEKHIVIAAIESPEMGYTDS